MSQTTQVPRLRTDSEGAAPKTRRRRRPRSPQWAAWAFLAPVSLYLVLFYAYPLYRNLDLSLR
ncbi:sugar ABC transporter permease, partial [Streptomyces sp. NPDC005760]